MGRKTYLYKQKKSKTSEQIFKKEGIVKKKSCKILVKNVTMFPNEILFTYFQRIYSFICLFIYSMLQFQIKLY